MLEHEIKILVDSTRIANNLEPLYNDSILYVAANHHARYLLKKGSLSHEEVEDKDFYSPQDRANYYGAPASYYVGENIVYTPYNARVKVKGRLFQTNNYREIARCLVYSWVKSKGHFKNIINPDYQVCGLAISIDTVKQRIYACQKFAQVLFNYDFEENKSFFPYSKRTAQEESNLLPSIPQELEYPFKLRGDKVEKCEECREVWESYPSMSVRVSRKNFILRVEEAAFVKELIKNRRDGFAIEIVPFDPFACGNPLYQNEASRRNGLKRTSGQVLEPVYRKDLMKGFKRRKRKKEISFVKYILSADSVSFFKRFGRYKLVNFDSKFFEIKLGRIPKNAGIWWNHNLMYIHDKQICHFLYLTNYRGDLELDLLDVPYYPPIPVNNYEFEIEHFSDTITLLYGPGETLSSGSELDTIIARYKRKNLKIEGIYINGFCSVEGNAAVNEQLHKERAENILVELKSLMKSDTLYKMNSKVDWAHFYKSVEHDEQWNFLFPLSKVQIKNYLDDPKNDRPLKILSEERKVKVEITGVRELTAKNSFFYVKRDMNNLFFKNKSQKLDCSSTDSLQLIYEKAYYFTTVDSLKINDFLKINIPSIASFMPHTLEHDVAFYRYHYLKDSVDEATLVKLAAAVEGVFEKCGAAEHLTPEFHYLSACLLIEKLRKNGKKNTVSNPTIQKSFDRLNLLLNWYDLEEHFKMDVSKLNLNVIYVLCETIDPDQVFEYNDIINQSLIQIVEYYRKAELLNPELVLKLAKLSVYFQNINLAVQLCEDYLDDDGVLKLYLTLAYNHSSFLSSKSQLEFEVYFHDLLMDAKARFSPEDWCSLFYGKYGIPFQVMDNKNLHTEFCNICTDRMNEVLAE